MSYLLWINDIKVIDENKIEYDFLNELYPEIKDLYNNIWRIKKMNDKPLDGLKLNQIDRLKAKIDANLELYGIPEYILFTEKDGKIIEPVSGTKLNISKKSLNLRDIDDDMVINEYFNALSPLNVNFLNDKFPKFKQDITKRHGM